MATSTRERVTVDLQGLRPRLFGMARQRHRSPSDLVREFVAQGLGEVDADVEEAMTLSVSSEASRVRICMRMPAEDCAVLKLAATAAGLDPGAFVAHLLGGADQACLGSDRPALLSQLKASNVELSHLSRSLRHLTALLGQGSVRAALAYREMLDGVELTVRQHLSMSAQALQMVGGRRAPSVKRAGVRGFAAGMREVQP